jgi:hypothetical protein
MWCKVQYGTNSDAAIQDAGAVTLEGNSVTITAPASQSGYKEDGVHIYGASLLSNIDGLNKLRPNKFDFSSAVRLRKLILGCDEGNENTASPDVSNCQLLEELDIRNCKAMTDIDLSKNGLLKKVDTIEFRGNVEGHDLFQGRTDVVVCDGFVGNVVLKTTESVAHAMSYWMKREFRGNFVRMLGSILLLGAFKSLKSQMDPEIYGGAPLLGVPGSVIITHGSSSHKAIYHAIRVGVLATKNDMTGEISRRIAEYEMHKKSESNG